MLEALLSPDYDGDGKLANDFASEIGRTVPLESLKLLICSDNPETRASGAFISTMMTRGRDLSFMIDELAQLLDDPRERVRADVIESISDWAAFKDSEILGRVMLHLDDESRLVRHIMIRVIQHSPSWMLQLAIDNAAKLKPRSAFSDIKEMCNLYRHVLAETILAMLNHSSATVRRFGIGLAAKPREIIFYRFLEEAEKSPDDEIKLQAALLLRESSYEWHHGMPSNEVPEGAKRDRKELRRLISEAVRGGG